MAYYSSSSEDDDQDERILKQALEVKISSDFNPNSLPQDGHQFLQHVIYERKKYKKLITSNINPERYTKYQTVLVPQDTPLQKSCDYVPTKEWQFKKLADFQDFRNYLHSLIGDNKPVTSFDEEFFLNSITNERPVYSKLTSLSQSAKIRKLEILSKYLIGLKPGTTVDDKVGMWIFAILALLEIPLSPSDCYVIREFAKRCINIRSQLLVKDNPSCALALNFFICIVSRFYNQLDLADE